MPSRIKFIVYHIVLFVFIVQASIDPYGHFDDDDDPAPPPPPIKASRAGGNSYSLDSDSDFNSNLRKPGSNKNIPPPNSETLFIHLVPHSHVDHGWLRTTDGYENLVFEILSSVAQNLDLDPKHRFVWAETWYFKRWYESLSGAKRDRIKRLVRESRFEFVGGGLVSHDESLSSQRLFREQLIEGHVFIEQTFGIPRPRIAWQIDAIGHSDSSPGLLSRLGFDVVVLNRVHFRVKERFRKGQHLEFIWRGSKPWSNDMVRNNPQQYADESHQIFAHLLPNSYASPEGHDFERSGARQVTTPRGRATKLLQYAKELSRSFRTQHVMIPWGDDFRFQDAEKQFNNMDKIFAEIATEHPSIRIQYSTASEYFEALQRSASATSLRFPVYSGDFLPYADAGDAYWVGTYSARAMLKRWARYAENKVFLAGFLFCFARAKSSVLGHVPRVLSIEAETGKLVADDVRPQVSWGMGLYRSLIFSKRQASLVGVHHQSITGQVKDAVAKDLLKRAKSSAEAASRVAMESLSILLTKRKSSDTSTTLIRPGLKPWNHHTDVLELKEDGKQWPLFFINERVKWKREVISIRIELASFALTKRIRVLDAEGNALQGQVHSQLVASNEEETGWKTDVHLFFLVHVPPLGFTTYFVSCVSASDRLGSAQQFSTSVLANVHHFVNGRISPSKNVEGVKLMSNQPGETKNGACFPIENSVFALEFDCETGFLRAVLDKKTKKRNLVKQEYRVHESARGGSALFRPDRLESSVLQMRGKLTIAHVMGPLVHEVQVIADGASQVVRLILAPAASEAYHYHLEAQAWMVIAVAGVNPDTDTVVRFTSDLKTGNAFFTDTPNGALRERVGVADAPLASNFFPCSSGLFLRSEAQILGLLFNQPVGCTGSANIASGGGKDFGVVELMLHRNPSMDDGRGLGEGLNDFGVNRLELLLFLDQTESGLQRRAGLVERMLGFGDYWMAHLDYSSTMAPLCNREVWVSRFVPSMSFLDASKTKTLEQVNLVSIFPRDETSDEVMLRVEPVFSDMFPSSVKVDFSQWFAPLDWVVFGAREFSLQSLPALSFQASDRVDDFASSSRSGDDSLVSSGFLLSEHASKENMGEDEEDKMKKPKKKTGGGMAESTAKDTTTAFPGGLLPSCPIMNTKAFTIPSFELKKGESRLFIVGLEYLPDVVEKKPPSSATKPRVKSKPADIEEEGEDNVEETRSSLRSQEDSTTTSGGRKSLAVLRSELVAEEKRESALEARSKRLQQNVNELLKELDMFDGVDGGLDKQAALEELHRAEEQLVEGNLMLKESKEKALKLQRELSQAEGVDELRAKHSRRHSLLPQQESSLHGFFAGAGGMLILVIAFQYFTGRRKSNHQAFVPVGVRYNTPVQFQNGFVAPSKRL